MMQHMEPAFPSTETTEGSFNSGLSKLEYYAGQVLNGIFANNFEYNSLELIAEIAFKSAQAMIKEGEKYK